MSGVQFQNAVAWGQVTSGPGVATVWAFGDAARGFTGAAVTWLVAFARSFGFDLVGARQFERLRTNTTIESLLAGTGSSLNGASALTLTALLANIWPLRLLAVPLVRLRGLRRNSTVPPLVTAVTCTLGTDVLAV